MGEEFQRAGTEKMHMEAVHSKWGMGNHVTVHRPTARASVRTTGTPMFNLTLSIRVQPDIAHPCCDQLTAVKTGYPLTSIT